MFHVKHDSDHPGVIVVGGGHAGCEAALAAARMGAKTVLATHRFDRIGEMSCNPAIGGLGKGHLVCEIDAMDGAMGIAADRAGIQFRLLNRRKGPAVRGPRAQCDRSLYRKAMQEIVSSTANLSVVQGEVVDLIIKQGRVSGVALDDGSEIWARSVVLTAGTFLAGLIHIGSQRIQGGRIGDAAAIRLADRLKDLGLRTGRLKTGTPPRLNANSIDSSVLERQPGDENPKFFSLFTASTAAPQIECAITHTNPKTHEIIRKNLKKSALYSGEIEGVGPRYCPSIEDKVVKFPDKSSHQIFLEPEGIDNPVIYPNGISTSLPEDTQLDYVQSMKGLEAAEILRPGYAIEYDYYDPTQLSNSLSVFNLPGLFFAGQINGTTGYEEAAAQGLYAGINAALMAKGKDSFQLDRSSSYIGVMIDDLTVRGVTEPYRMFTSRAEFRLTLRADNADQRLTPKGAQLGCVGDRRRQALEQKLGALEAGRALLKAQSLTPQEARRHSLDVNLDGQRRTGFDLLAYRDIDIARLTNIWPQLAEIPTFVCEQLENDALYRNYIDRHAADIASLRRDNALPIPPDFNFYSLPGLTTEFATKLTEVRPSTLAQASQIEGATPAGLVLLLAHLKKTQRNA